MKITKKQINNWVTEAIQMVPDRMMQQMRHLVFVVDDRPTRQQVKSCQLKRGYALFGLYEGNEQTGKRKKTVAPDKISVFRRAIMEQFVRPSKVRQQIFKTVWHEIAHHFGADETKAEKAELRMFEKYVRQQGLCGAL